MWLDINRSYKLFNRFMIVWVVRQVVYIYIFNIKTEKWLKQQHHENTESLGNISMRYGYVMDM